MVIIPIGMRAQSDVVFEAEESLWERFQVPQVGEFMSRINGCATRRISDTLSRRIDIVSLFRKDVYLSSRQYVEDFVEKVISLDRYVDFGDNDLWYARARCVIETASKETGNITLALKTDEYGEGLYKWVIAGAYGDMLDLVPEKRNPGLRIAPTDNEVNFMSLSHISTTEQKNILNYSCRNYQPDGLSVFNTLIYNGLIYIRYVEDLTYVFNIAGYRLEVSYCHPQSGKHNGWLVSDISPDIEELHNMEISPLSIMI